ncbi:MAG: hypothetical protein AAGI01_10095, partial [Myxococcota bacterium]
NTTSPSSTWVPSSTTLSTVICQVEEGEVVLTFLRDTLELEMRDLLEKLEVAEAQLLKTVQQLDSERINLELELKRKQLALERARLQVVEGVNLTSKLDLDKNKIDVERAELELELAEKALATFKAKRATSIKIENLKIETARQNVEDKREGLDLVELKAPTAGMVYAPYTRINWQRTKVAPGVVARNGDKVLELPDLSAYHAHIYVRQRDVSLVHVGDEAIVTPVILPDLRIPAKVIKKEDFATTRNERLGGQSPAGNLKEYLVVLELERAHDLLRPGNSARVEISSTLAEGVVRVPVSALVKRDEGGYVVRMAGTGAQRPVKVGKTTSTLVEILEGLEDGEQVVLSAPSSPEQSVQEVDE